MYTTCVNGIHAAALKKLGIITAGSKPMKPRIASILSRLYDSNELERTFVGKGNIPHKYKNINAGSEIIEE